MLSDFIVLLILSVHNLFDLESYFHFLFVSVHYLKFPHILSSFFFVPKTRNLHLMCFTQEWLHGVSGCVCALRMCEVWKPMSIGGTKIKWHWMGEASLMWCVPMMQGIHNKFTSTPWWYTCTIVCFFLYEVDYIHTSLNLNDNTESFIDILILNMQSFLAKCNNITYIYVYIFTHVKIWIYLPFARFLFHAYHHIIPSRAKVILLHV